MSLYVKVVEYIRNFDIKDISKFSLEYNPLTKAYNLSRWDYTEETDGITRPDLALLNASTSVDLTFVEEELQMNNCLLPKHRPGDSFYDATIRLYSRFVITARTALDTERTIPVGLRHGNRLVADIGSTRSVDTTGSIILKFSGCYRITVSGECSWPEGQQSVGAVKLVHRIRQLPNDESLSRPPYLRTEHVVYETTIGATTNKYFTFTIMRNFNREDMLQFRGTKTQGTTLLLTANILVECFNISTNQPYFRFNTPITPPTPPPAPVPAATE
jgi:hypothetical protein